MADKTTTWTLALPDEEASLDLARFIAEETEPGDIIALSGGLGAGKSTLARALIRHLADDQTLDVPSPTFSIMQIYETNKGRVIHADLYRIHDASELLELGWEEELENGAIFIVEWPDKAENILPRHRLDIALALYLKMGPDARVAMLKGSGALAGRLARTKALRTLLEKTRWSKATRLLMQGDASTRLYERLEKDTGEQAILMFSPPRPDGPPIRRGKSYSTIARLAEDIRAFIAVDQGLRALNLSAPEIYGSDLETGLLILEDFGLQPVIDEQGPLPERYEEATRVLAHIHGMDLPRILPVCEGIEHSLPPYDMDAFLIETELLIDWYLPYLINKPVSGSAQAEFLSLWQRALAPVIAEPPTWVLRDYHSPNLIWLEERKGLARVGLIDFQDAVLGPAAYDVVSLLQDARVTVSPELELRLLSLYAKTRKKHDSRFNFGDFAGSYAILGAQRATKILGIFARLDRRDGKHHYLAHLPRIEAYLKRDLNHTALEGLKNWYQNWLPHLWSDQA